MEKQYKINIQKLLEHFESGNEFKYTYYYTDVKKKECKEIVRMYKEGKFVITEIGEKPAKEDIYRIDITSQKEVTGLQRLDNVIKYDLKRGTDYEFNIKEGIVEQI